jgi:hypothetical protein
MRAPSRPSLLKRILRRVGRPLMAPIDGRVADVNRRIGHVGSALAQQEAVLHGDAAGLMSALASSNETVAVFARTASEATAYTGIELRRLEETLRANGEQLESLSARGLNAYYRDRLARAVDLPLEKLDGALAHLLNHAAGHRGLAAQADMWFNPPVVVELSEGSARVAAVNERIVEMPFAMAALGRLSPPARILDIGSAESTFPLSAASLGYRVAAVDLRPLPYLHPNLESWAGRFEDWEPPAEPFDAAFLISTIEHVGVGAYGEVPYGSSEAGRGADRAMVERLRGLLVPGGLLVLTTPYGEGKIDELERTYDDEALGALLEGWEVLERRLVVRRDPTTWLPGEGTAAAKGGVAMLVLSSTAG